MVLICHEMHWTYQQYDAQPDWLLDTLRIKLEEDNKYAEHKQNKVGRK